jgi:hypothetical protein
MLTMQEQETHGAASSHIIGWSRSRKAMRLRQLLRTDVQHNKHVSKRGVAGLFFPVLWSRSRIILVEP